MGDYLEIRRVGRPTFDPEPVLAFVREYIKRTGFSPTLEEIGQGLGLSKGAIWNRVDAMCDPGLLNKRRYGLRSITIGTKEVNCDDG